MRHLHRVETRLGKLARRRGRDGQPEAVLAQGCVDQCQDTGKRRQPLGTNRFRQVPLAQLGGGVGLCVGQFQAMDPGAGLDERLGPLAIAGREVLRPHPLKGEHLRQNANRHPRVQRLGIGDQPIDIEYQTIPLRHSTNP
jgi:hypothetical protein